MKFSELPIPGAYLLEQEPHGDSRGQFSRLFCRDEFAEYGLTEIFTQINHSFTRERGTVRGIHYQRSPHAEVKVISCMNGEVFDVIVDLRRNSPAFLKWHGELISRENRRMIYLPEGVAHGFQTLSDNCELLYFHSTNYAPESEGGVRFDDPAVSIKWRLPVEHCSERDRNFHLLNNDFKGLDI